VNFKPCGTFGAVGALPAQLIGAIASEIANAQLPTVAIECVFIFALLRLEKILNPSPHIPCHLLVLELLIFVVKLSDLWQEVN